MDIGPRSASETAPTRGSVDPRVVLFGRPGCHLCDDARVTVEKVCAEAGISWREVSIADDDELLATYGELIPVVEVDGRRVGFWRIPEEDLKHAIAEY